MFLQALERLFSRYRSQACDLREGVGMQVLATLISMVYLPEGAAVPVGVRQIAKAALLAGLLQDFPFYLASDSLADTVYTVLHVCLTPCLAYPEVRLRALFVCAQHDSCCIADMCELVCRDLL